MARDNKKPLTARLPPDVIDNLKSEAERRKLTVTELIELALNEYQHGTGATGRQVDALKAIIAEQDKIIRRATGKPTPSKKRVTVRMSVADLNRYERHAREVNMTRSEFLSSVLANTIDSLENRTARLIAEKTDPALPAPHK